jgi:hypothetical protein
MTNLLSDVLEVCKVKIKIFKRTMELLVGFGAKNACHSFGLDVVKDMFVRVSLRKVPGFSFVVGRTFFRIFLPEYKWV